MLDWQRERAWLEKDAESTRSMRRIVRLKEPQNLEFPFSALDRFVTPTELFYVRSHFKAPTIDPNLWRLRIEGCGEREVEFSLAELKAMEAETRTVTLECGEWPDFFGAEGERRSVGAWGGEQC